MGELRRLRSGTLVEVDDKGKATFLGCGWLVERARVVTQEMAEAGWYADFPSDLVEVGECGARVQGLLDADGVWRNAWRCESGHQFLGIEVELAPGGPEWQREQEERAGVGR